MHTSPFPETPLLHKTPFSAIAIFISYLPILIYQYPKHLLPLSPTPHPHLSSSVRKQRPLSPTMAFALIPMFLLLSSLSSIPQYNSQLTDDYYAKSCPRFEEIMQDAVTDKQISTPVTAAATLRVFFHDCMVDGCDASVLISSTPSNKAEKDFDINQSLAGDAFDLVTRAKHALELACPGVVSCADILAVATRNLIKIVGGPLLKIQLGRKDSLVSQASRVEGNLARVNQSMDQIIELFRRKNYSVEEMVALVGAGHTIGFSHCKEFGNRIFNFSPTSQIDPTMNPKFANALRSICDNYQTRPTVAAFNDPMTPGIFDNMYFQNLLRGMGLLATDQAFMADPRTRSIVERYAKNQTAFFADFTRAMEKTSTYGVKTGNDGEVRLRCDVVNIVKT